MPKKDASVVETKPVAMDRDSIAPVQQKKEKEMRRAEDVISKEELADLYQNYNRHFFKSPSFIWWFLCLGGMICTAIIAYAKEPVRHLLPLEMLAFAIFGTREKLRVIFQFACVAHLIEAQYAAYICMFQLKILTWPLWACQTFLLGWPSLSILIARRKQLDLISAMNLKAPKKKSEAATIATLTATSSSSAAGAVVSEKEKEKKKAIAKD